MGGLEISITKSPYQVSLQNSFGVHLCGGAVITNQWVLTAAHCLYGSTKKQFSVRAGSSQQNAGGKVLNVNQIIQHPQFNPNNFDFDFSLLKLAESVSFDGNVQKIALPQQGEPIKDGTEGLVSGWGSTLKTSESQINLRAAYVPIVNQLNCDKAYSNYGGVTDRMICAGFLQGGKDACQGDSGGPLVANGKLIGIVSWGLGCALPNYPGVYGRVAAVRDWIQKTTGV